MNKKIDDEKVQVLTEAYTAKLRELGVKNYVIGMVSPDPSKEGSVNEAYVICGKGGYTIQAISGLMENAIKHLSTDASKLAAITGLQMNLNDLLRTIAEGLLQQGYDEDEETSGVKVLSGDAAEALVKALKESLNEKD